MLRACHIDKHAMSIGWSELQGRHRSPRDPRPTFAMCAWHPSLPSTFPCMLSLDLQQIRQPEFMPARPHCAQSTLAEQGQRRSRQKDVGIVLPAGLKQAALVASGASLPQSHRAWRFCFYYSLQISFMALFPTPGPILVQCFDEVTGARDS